MARRSRPQQPALACFFLLCIHLVLASASFLRPLPRPESEDHGGGGLDRAHIGARTCWYTVQIKTSCDSPARTADAVGLAFGDAYGNEAYAARLDAAGVFTRCAKDTFKVGGPCGYGICYLYLRRSGRSGWTPEWVRVYEPTSSSGTPSTFRYGDPLPDNVWYGFNRCPRRAAADGSSASSSSESAAVQAM
ncbi:embryo-specific protein ATS3A [Brachypodium distachyon]|uniref:Embryo-specific protein 3 n=1 Tax=Brachypodium distachyon TaxID=15368 RepID=I1HCG8_BRADI|nr:embryo-specific protein ATS3A [Brachypodium distachyon]KQK02933.1 hypothetical protein BRADI_2g04510v3 [Brachypodium distachyon]|eukprot:XP_010230524.1 embryo-specific protein ATS3A [Brachypodium distachyon]